MQAFDPDSIFTAGPDLFEDLAIALFHFQYGNNLLYRSFVDALQIDPAQIHSINRIPFLPISFFKTHSVETGSFDPEIVFDSSGTSGQTPSRHFLKDLSLYEKSFMKGFSEFYGNISDYCIIGLLPSYLERKGSSLVCMVEALIRKSGHPESRFYLYENDRLSELLEDLEKRKQKTLLIGVSFALLDFAEKFNMKLQHTILMETGGMKGRREELTRQELHAFLRAKLGVQAVHSEYGMTELLSQAYSQKDGLFRSVPWMKMMVRKEDDPFAVEAKGEGVLNIIDLANCWSCAFIATDDAVRIHDNGLFEVLGRTDNSDVRGCSLLLL